MLATIVLNLAYVALVGSTFTRTVVWLRLMILAGSCCFITFGILAGIPSIVFWNLLIGGLHIVNLLKIASGRRANVDSPLEEWFRRYVFADLATRDFNAIWARGRDVVHEDRVLTYQDVVHDRVALIMSGVVEVRVDGELVSRLGPGAFLGEMSFVSGGAASADTTARGRVQLREWRREDLEGLDSKNTSACRALEQSIMRALAWKMVGPSAGSSTNTSPPSTTMASVSASY